VIEQERTGRHCGAAEDCGDNPGEAL
jgi:hypothetical protein